MQHRFKMGDSITCTNVVNTRGRLHMLKTYTVEEYDPLETITRTDYVLLAETGDWWAAERFTLTADMHAGDPIETQTFGPLKDEPVVPVAGGYPDNNPKSVIGVTKAPLRLVPPAAIIVMAEAFADGAVKYGAYNWRSNKVAVSVYVDAALRHLLAYWDGEQNSADSGVHHLGHAMDCMAIIVDAEATGNLVDDRPVAGAAARLLNEYQEKHNAKQ